MQKCKRHVTHPIELSLTGIVRSRKILMEKLHGLATRVISDARCRRQARNEQAAEESTDHDECARLPHEPFLRLRQPAVVVVGI